MQHLEGHTEQLNMDRFFHCVFCKYSGVTPESYHLEEALLQNLAYLPFCTEVSDSGGRWRPIYFFFCKKQLPAMANYNKSCILLILERSESARSCSRLSCMTMLKRGWGMLGLVLQWQSCVWEPHTWLISVYRSVTRHEPEYICY